MEVLLTAAQLFDGTGRDPIQDAAVLVNDEKIEAAGSREDVTAPSSVEVIDLGDRTLMPGMVDAHMAFTGIRSLIYSPGGYARILEPHDLRVLRSAEDARKLLLAGFTAVRDTASHIGLGIKQAVEEGAIPGPRVKAAGRVITQTGGHGDVVVLPLEMARAQDDRRIADGVDDCIRAVREQVREGAEWVKIITGNPHELDEEGPAKEEFTLAEIKAMCDEAHRLGVMVCAHATGVAGIRNAVEGGVDTIEHGFYASPEVMSMVADAGIWLIPTLSWPYRVGVLGEEYQVPADAVTAYRKIYENHVESLNMAVDAGVKIAMGTDNYGAAIRPHGSANAMECELMVRAGMSERDVLVSCTRNGAEAIGLGEATGTVEAGKFADLIAVSDDPIQDISTLQHVDFVMKGGQVFLNQVE